MSLEVHSVVNRTSPDKEFVWIKVNADVNTSGYAIVDRTFDKDGKVSNEFRHIFVFPPTAVKKGEWIRLFTGNGKHSTIQSSSGSTIHNFYWQADSCVWNNSGGDKASLIKYSVINSVSAPLLKK